MALYALQGGRDNKDCPRYKSVFASAYSLAARHIPQKIKGRGASNLAENTSMRGRQHYLVAHIEPRLLSSCQHALIK